jgi:hypothetical protein
MALLGHINANKQIIAAAAHRGAKLTECLIPVSFMFTHDSILVARVEGLSTFVLSKGYFFFKVIITSLFTTLEVLLDVRNI